jgi:hypothetical protein
VKKIGMVKLVLLIALMSLWACGQALGATAGVLLGMTNLTPTIPSLIDATPIEPVQENKTPSTIITVPDALKPNTNLKIPADIFSKTPVITYPKGGEVLKRNQPCLVEYSASPFPSYFETRYNMFIAWGFVKFEPDVVIKQNSNYAAILWRVPDKFQNKTGAQLLVTAFWDPNDKNNLTDTYSGAFSVSESLWSSLVKAVPGDNSVTLSWDPVSAAPGKVAYTIQRSKPGSNWTAITDFPVNETSYTDNKVQNNTTYLYRILANIGGSGLPLYEDVSVTPLPSNTLVFTVGSATILLNGVEKQIDSPPVIVEGRTFVPVRALMENIGGYVNFDAALQEITFSYKNKTIVMQIGSNEATVNGNPVELDAPPYITSEGRTMIPLRFITENLGLYVLWDFALQSITIRF